MLNARVDGSDVVLVAGRQSRWRHRVCLKLTLGFRNATTDRLTSDVLRAHDEVVRVIDVLLLLAAAVFFEVLRLHVGHRRPVFLSLAVGALQQIAVGYRL